MFELLELDHEFNLDELLNVTDYEQQILSRFDAVSEVLNKTIDGFVKQDDIDKLSGLKGELMSPKSHEITMILKLFPI